MGPDVVGVAVAAERVVGRDDIGLVAADQPDQAAGGVVEIGLPEGARVEVPGSAHHVGVVVAEVLPLGHAQDPHRPFQLAGPDLGQPAVVLRRVHRRDDDLALLAAGARHEHDPMPGGHGLGHRAAGPDRLVVGMGVDGHEGGSVGRRLVRLGGRGRGVGSGHRLGIVAQVSSARPERHVGVIGIPHTGADDPVAIASSAACLAMVVAVAACGASGSAPATGGSTRRLARRPTQASPVAAAVKPRSGPVLDQPWATVELTDVTTGEVFRLADHAGKVLIIETMAIWCPTCQLQQAAVDEALARLDPAKVKYVVLDVDLHEDAADLARYQAELGFDGTFAVAGIPVARALAEEFGANVLNPPLTPIVIVSTDGTATLTEYGRKSAEEIVALVAAAGA